MQKVLLGLMEQDLRGAFKTVECPCALLNPSGKTLGPDYFMNGTAPLMTRAENNFKHLIATFSYGPTQSSTSVLEPGLSVETVAPITEKMEISRLEERREERVKEVAYGGSSSGGAWPLVPVRGGTCQLSERC